MTPEEERLIRKRAEQHTEVLAVVDRRRLLAEIDRLRAERDTFTREDVGPVVSFRHTEPGYWRLVGPKHYKPEPPEPTPEEVAAVKRWLEERTR